MALFSDVPAMQHERVSCSIMAAIKYQIPVNILLAIAEKEGGKSGQWVKNTNGTYDVGSMQLNTVYLKELERYGIKAADVAVKGCYAYDLAAWRVRGHLVHDVQDIWTRAANYHSRTPRYNQIYRADLIKKAIKWQKWLEVRFPTYAVNTQGTTPLEVHQVSEIHTNTAKMERKTPKYSRTSHQDLYRAPIAAQKALEAFYSSAPSRNGL